MISIEKARELKSSGLGWEPKEGDAFATDASTMANIYYISGVHELHETLGGTMFFFWGHLCSRDGGCIANETAAECMQKKERYNPEGFNLYHIASYDDFIWLPSLNQLLAEIEVRYPYIWQVGRVESGRYKIALMDQGYNVTSFDADTPEDAAADALLWILKEGQK